VRGGFDAEAASCLWRDRVAAGQIKMVPSDPRSSLLPSRHARPERGFDSAVLGSLCSPRRLLACAAQRAGRSHSAMPKEPASRGGLSLAWSGFPLLGSLSRVFVPDLPLRRLAVPLPWARSVACSAPRGRFCGLGEVHRMQPVAHGSGPQSRGVFSLAPPRDLSIPPVPRSTDFVARSSPSRKSGYPSLPGGFASQLALRITAPDCLTYVQAR